MASSPATAQAMDRAAAAFAAGRTEEAASLCAAVLREEPSHFYALHLACVLALQQARWQEALDLSTRALAVRPGHPEVRANRGAALRRLDRHAEALAEYDAVLAAHPQAADARNNRGVALAALGRHEEAIAEYARAAQAAPGHAEAFHNLGVSLAALARHGEAIAACNRALAIDARHVRARWNRALSLLAMGHWAEGFAEYEARRVLGDARWVTRAVSGTPWTGRESVAGRTVLLLAEQGFGDALMFCRFARVLHERGARVILEAPGEVGSLLAPLPWLDRVVAKGEPLPAFDLYCPLASLPALLGTRLETLPAQEPPLHAPPAFDERWHERLSTFPRPRIGIAWSGGLAPGSDDPRAIALSHWAGLRELPASFIALQKRIDRAEAALLDATPRVHRFEREIEDFRDTAALIAQVDLVITVDTAVAHLAGAMGRPVWILLPFAADWRWLLGREDSPWYPSARLFRQARPGDREGVMARVREELQRFLAGDASALGPSSPDHVRNLLASGRYAEAEAIARERSERDPSDAQWLHLLGAAQHVGGRPADAVESLERAARGAPGDARVRNTLAAARMALDDLAGAEQALEESLRLDPRDAEARFNLARLAQRRGDTARALEVLDRLVRERPDHFPARLEHALVLLRAGRAAQARDAFTPLVASAGTDVRVLLGAASAHAALGAFDEAAALAQRAANAAPGQAEVLERVGDLLAACGRPGEAQRHFEFAATRKPRDAALLTKLAAAAHAQGDAARAVELYRAALAAAPDARAGAMNLAVALHESGERDAAKDVLERAIASGHHDAEMLDALATYKALECDWRGLDELVSRLRSRGGSEARHPAHPQGSLFYEGVDAAEQREWAERWSRMRWAAEVPRPPWRPRERLRVGFLSGDFHAHATAWLLAGMVEAHDRERFEFIAYSHAVDDATDIRERLKRGFDRFVEVGALDDAAAARRIGEDAVDIVLDLGGHTRSGRLGVLAHRPAPLQGHFLGYPGTTGAPFVDFFVADEITAPREIERGFSETLVRVPGCYQPNDRLRPQAEALSRAACGLPPAGLVFCSFNQPIKITASVFAQWCELLHAVPGSVLWLTALDARAEANLRREAAARGVDPARLVFAPRVGIAAHLARLRHADLALDTFPCGSHTTASDVLWSGVPLVTARGETFASRVASSVLAAAGCGDGIFDDRDRAFEAILALARSPQRLAAAKARARAALSSPLFDAAAHARGFEAMLHEVAREAARFAGRPAGGVE